MLDPGFLVARGVTFPVFDTVDPIAAEPAWNGRMENTASAATHALAAAFFSAPPTLSFRSIAR
ncbi:hypothetical protein HH310_17605 [Actinoplanes sp. TBRC 11911]|uniref:hypothetical protein n=1 Tax=Actinoplanes sp. TBRC 11911 TaxID=2729386 RepID=UPI00145E6979|nr:hypothetical protein [Actinoplanes sp. TBRC 11911]NMO53000.1 hypothetical protein [Actinoplanes sp. TBRC 11911]